MAKCCSVSLQAIELEVSAQVAEAEALACSKNGQSAVVHPWSMAPPSTPRLRRGPASIDSRTRTGEALVRIYHRTLARARRHVSHAARRTLATARGDRRAAKLGACTMSGQAYVYVLGPIKCRRRRCSRADQCRAWAHATAIMGRSLVNGLELNQRIVGAGAAFLQRRDEVRALAAPALAPRQLTAKRRRTARHRSARPRIGPVNMAWNISAGAIRNPIPPIVLMLALDLRRLDGVWAACRSTNCRTSNFGGFTVDGWRKWAPRRWKWKPQITQRIESGADGGRRRASATTSTISPG